MHRILVFLLSLVLASSLSAALTTVEQTIKNPDGATFNGHLEIKLNEICTEAGGSLIYPETKVVAVSAGAFTVQLYPNTTCTPSGTSYFVKYVSRGQITKMETWVVGVTTPTTIDAVRTDTVPSPDVGVAISQLTGCTAKGSLLAGDSAGLGCFAVGTDGKFLKANSAQSNGVEWADAMADPMTTLGDVIYRDASAPARLAGNITTTKKFFNQTGTGSANQHYPN
jgi:hypothetical protein